MLVVILGIEILVLLVAGLRVVKKTSAGDGIALGVLSSSGKA